MKIAIFGAGGLGRELLCLINLINAENSNSEFKFIGWFDDSIEKGTLISNFPVLGGLNELNNHSEPLGVVIGLGDARLRRTISSKINNSLLSYPSLIHPSIELNEYQNIEIGYGVIIQKGSVITCDIKIGNFVLVNLNCTIGHDTEVRDYCALMPGVHISGECIIEEASYFGTNSTVINQINVGEGAVIGASACVAKDIFPNTLNVGVPSKSIKEI